MPVREYLAYVKMESVDELRTRYPAQRKRPSRALSADERLILRQDAARKRARQNLTSNSRVAAAALPVAGRAALYAGDKMATAAYETAKRTAEVVARAGSAAMTPTPAPPQSTVIHNHYHQTPTSERTVGALLHDVGSDTARNVGSDLLTSAIAAGTALFGKRLADRKRKKQLEARPAEFRGGDPVAPRPDSDEGQLPAGADEPTRPPPASVSYQSQLALFSQMLDELE